MNKLLGRCISFIRKTNLNFRLKWTFCLVSIFPVLLSSLYFYQTYSNKCLKNSVLSTIENLQQTGKTIDATLENYRYFCGKLGIDSEVQSALLQAPLGHDAKEALSYYVQKQFISASLYPAYLHTIKIADLSGDFIYDMGYDDVSTAEYQAILEATRQAAPQDTWFYVNTYLRQDTIILCRQINNINNMNQPLGYCMLFINEKLFTKDILSHAFAKDGANISIIKGDGLTLTSTDVTLPREEQFYDAALTQQIFEHYDWKNSSNNYFNYDLNHQTFSVTYNYNETLDSYMVSTTPLSSIQKDFQELLPMMILFVLILLGICSLSGSLIYHSILVPIHGAMHVCNEISENNLSSRIPVESKDELAFLSIQINNMLDKNEELLLLNKKKEEKKRLLELEVLRYQINPHFLFNTLNTLKWISELNQIPSLVDITSSLSEILKETLVNKDHHITLAQEIDLLKHYILIQQHRYVNKFQIQFQIQPELTEIKLPRLILQPLVENAIYHGTYDDGRMITITVSARLQEQTAMIQVADTGRGFDLREPIPRSKSRSAASIGLTNVRERILQTYGPSGSFTICSEKDQGTSCTICIPYRLDDPDAV